MTRASRGDTSAFEELYRRHAEAAWRVARSTARGPHDAADAVSDAFTKVFENLRRGKATHVENFRSYLMATTRNAAVDRHRRGSRERPEDTVADDGTAAPSSDVVIDLTDASLVGEAFDDLPDRWREVLWLTEVEEMEPAAAAEKLGVKRGALGQLAFRARAGLRERYVRAHLSDVDGPCKRTVENLAAYVLDDLPPGKRARVDQHLRECEPCRDRRDEIENLGETLRRVVFPLPVGLAGLTSRRFTERIGSKVAGGFGHGSGRLAESPLAKAAVGATAAGLAISGLFSLGQLDAAQGIARGPLGSPPSTVVDEPDDSASPDEITLTSPTRPQFDAIVASARTPVASEPAGNETAQTGGEATDGAATGGGGTGTDPTSSTPDEAPAATKPPADDSANDNGTSGGDDGDGDGGSEPLAQVVVKVTTGDSGDTDATVAAGAGDDACNGAEIGDEGAGCTEPEGDATVVTVDPTDLP